MLAELTVCFETNFVDASQRKRDKYQDLLETSTANGYTTTLITLEVGSRGFEQLLRHFPYSKGGKLNLLRAVSREAILQTHKIWTARNNIN